MNFKANIVIDLDKLKENVQTLIDTYGDYKHIFANLKNKAFGMGYGIIDTLVSNGINYIFVSTLEEALEIRKLKTNVKILVSYEVLPEYVYDAALNNISITISSLEHLKKISSLKLKDKLNLHILIDNGNNKIGLKNKSELSAAIDLINSNDKLNLEGIYTEFTTYGILDEEYYKAFNLFINLVKSIKKDDLIVHINEPGMYHRKNKLINGLRFDLTLLGIEENINDDFLTNMKIKNIDKKYQDLEFPNFDLNLIFSIEAEIIGISRAYKNTLVGRNYIAKEDMNLAVIPIGYKDGITKALGRVVIGEKICPIVADEIDYLLIIAPNTARIGDKVIIIDENSNIYDIIGALKTNRFYLMSILNNNLDRVYINASEDEDLL